MPVTFEDLLKDKQLNIKNRKDIKTFYTHMRNAIFDKKLTPDGHSLPTTMNAWIKQVEGDKKLLSNDYDVVNFSVSEDSLKPWLAQYKQKYAPVKTVYVTQHSRDILEAVQDLEKAQQESLQQTNNKKEDVLSAMSDLQAAVALFLSTYDSTHKKLRLPDRTLNLERVKVKK